MKKLKTLFTMMAVSVAAFLLPESSCMKAAAEEPVTYAVKYLENEEGSGEWRYQSGASTFDDSAFHRELYYLRESIKDGDLVVVYNGSATSPDPLDLGTVRLQNLTVVQTASFTSIKSGDIEDCYILAGNSCAINSNVTNAHVYGTTLCNFNYNVQELNVYALGEDPTATVGCSGTVHHYLARTEALDRTFSDLYDFQANSFLIRDGILQVPESQYSHTPTTQTPAPTAAPQQSAASSGTSNDEYDEVPKTGESHPVLWLICLAGICIAASCALRKADAQKH